MRADQFRQVIYDYLVAQFREVTSVDAAGSGRCCANVRAGAPECCYQVVDGADLTFTTDELALVGILSTQMTQRVDGMWVFDRAGWDWEQVLPALLRDGSLANSLECASHPTRPVIQGDHVFGVVVVNACNAPSNLDHYRAHREILIRLWQDALCLLGAKPYYAQTSIKEDWTWL